MLSSEKFLWTCELSKDEPVKKWKAGDLMELEDEEDKDYVLNSIIFQSAVLGSTAVDGERNLVSVKTKGYMDKDLEQPIFSLTLGRNDMVSGMNLTLASDHNPEVEFKLINGTGPVHITCTHLIELPAQDDENQTLMTASDGENEDIENSSEEEQVNNKKNVKNGIIKNGTHKNGKANGKNGENADEAVAKEDFEVTEKPSKRKRN